MSTSNMNIATSLRALLTEWIEQEEHMNELAKKKPEYRSHFLGAETGMMRHRIELEVLMSHLGMRESQPSTLDGEAVTIDPANLVTDIVEATKQRIPLDNECESPVQQLDTVFVSLKMFKEMIFCFPEMISQQTQTTLIFDARDIAKRSEICSNELYRICGSVINDRIIHKQVKIISD